MFSWLLVIPLYGQSTNIRHSKEWSAQNSSAIHFSVMYYEATHEATIFQANHINIYCFVLMIREDRTMCVVTQQDRGLVTMNKWDKCNFIMEFMVKILLKELKIIVLYVTIKTLVWECFTLFSWDVFTLSVDLLPMVTVRPLHIYFYFLYNSLMKFVCWNFQKLFQK